MKQGIFTIVENTQLTDTVYKLRLKGDTSAITAPGQFINIKLEGYYLRRPIAVCETEGDVITLLYKVVGHGTEHMTSLPLGTSLNILTGLGNGFDTAKSGDAPLLVGGGVGIPPIYALAKALRAEGKKVTVILGFNTASERFYEDEFKALGCETLVTTVDGSFGIKGFVTDALPESYSFFYACGPEPMLKALHKAAKTSGELSFAERMGCGFGACMGCTCETLTGFKRICKDGPVLMKEEIKWAD